MVITGRECEATTRRMNELRAYALFQNVRNKGEFLNEYMTKNGILPDEAAYIGDDLIDIPAMKACGFSSCPADACEEVKTVVNYVSEIKGGNGAFRDVVKYIMSKEGTWEKTIDGMFEAGV